MNRKMTVAAALVGAAALFFGVNSAASAHSLGKVVAGVKAKGPINQLVKAGTVTQAEADAFTAAMKSAAKTALTAAKTERDAVRDQVLTNLVANGTLPQSVADLIKAGGAAFKDAVLAGNVTQAQLGALKDAMKAAAPIGSPMADLVKQVTDQLVSENKLTSAAAAAIVAALPGDRAAIKGKGIKKKIPGFGKGLGKGHGGKEKRS